MRLNSLARYYHDFFKIFSSPSLKIKITLTVLLLFLCSIFLLAFLISKLLESDLIAQIEEQQFSTASYIADSIEGQVKLRFDSLSTIASLITPELISNPGKLREFLRQQPTLSNLFLAGVIVISKDGKIITDYPVVAGRASASVDFEYFKEVVATEKPAVGKPRIGRFSKTPRVSFAVPVFDHSGKLIAVLAGHVSLSDPSLLGTIQALSYKDFPDRLTVVSPKYHMVIAGTDPARVMTPTPKPGVSFLHDKFMAGFEGSGVYENSRGIRMLSSGKQIPAPGWFVRLGLPADIAFAPIRSMKRWAYSIALGLSLLSSILVWLIVRQMLRPLYASSALIRDIAEKHLPPQNIPVIQHDEIGQLITSFNQLLNHRDKTEQALRESENRYRSIFDNRQVVMLLIDPETMKIVDANAAALFYYGYTSDQLQNMKITDINMASDDFIVSEAHAAAREEKDRFLFRHRLADGAIRDVEVFSGPIEIQGAKLLYSIIHDITERKQAELAVIKSEEKFFKLFMSTPAAISVSKLDNGCLIDVNKEFESVLGFNRDEIIGHTSHELGLWVDTVDRDRIVNWIQKDGRIRDSELKLKSKNGVVHTCRYFGDSLEIDGTPYLLSAFVDITERKQVEEKLQQSEQFILKILDTVDEGFIVVDRDYRIQIANRAYCSQLPHPCDDIIGENCFAVSHGHSRPCYEEGEECAVRKVFEDGVPHTVAHKHTGPDGSVIFVETKAFPLRDSSGNITSAIEVVTNVTEKRLLEEERLKTQKLEAVGTLAGGIAHDFNNLLQGVFGYISLAKLRKDAREKSIEALEEAEKALHMTVKLTSQLLTFSKGGKPVKKTIDPLPVIETAVKFALSGSRSDFQVAADDNLWKVDADEGQISQVIQNIILNADQAMPDAGRVEIVAKNVQVPGTDHPQELGPGRYVEISITDTGIGIHEKYLNRIFDPYFTTKEKGSGLGLATSYSIIRNHGGLINVTSELGKGTTFRIYLPTTAANADEGQPNPAIALSGKRGRILLMDDEELVLNIVRELIRALGHEIETAANGTEALKKYREARDQRKPFDIAILDLTVRGGMGGVETVKRLLELDPKVKAVVSSGYSDDAVVAFYEQQGFKAVLKKPYNVDELKDILNKVLEEKEER